MIRVLEGVAAIKAGKVWIAWDIYGPVRGTASRSPASSLRKYARLTSLSRIVRRAALTREPTP